METELPLKAEGIVVAVSEPRIMRDKRSSRFGRLRIELSLTFKEEKIVGGRRILNNNQSFWSGEDLQELLWHRVQVYNDGNNQAIYDVNTDRWYRA